MCFTGRVGIYHFQHEEDIKTCFLVLKDISNDLQQDYLTGWFLIQSDDYWRSGSVITGQYELSKIEWL